MRREKIYKWSINRARIYWNYFKWVNVKLGIVWSHDFPIYLRTKLSKTTALALDFSKSEKGFSDDENFACSVGSGSDLFGNPLSLLVLEIAVKLLGQLGWSRLVQELDLGRLLLNGIDHGLQSNFAQEVDFLHQALRVGLVSIFLKLLLSESLSFRLGLEPCKQEGEDGFTEEPVLRLLAVLVHGVANHREVN